MTSPGAVERIILDADHHYWLGKQRVYGFTEIATDLGIIKPNPFHTEFGRDRGTAVHDWLAFIAEGNEPENEPDERIAGYVAAIRKFLAESGFKCVGAEKPLYEPVLRYGVKPDLWGHLGAFSCVIEAKRGAKLPYHFLQTAAQKIALAANGFNAQRRYGLYLSDGDYRLVPHENRADEGNWKNIVAAFHSKRFYEEAI